MSEVSQIAPRVAAVVQASDGFRNSEHFTSGLVSAGFHPDEAIYVMNQLPLDPHRPLSKFECLAAIEAWVRFHDEFQTVERRHRRRRG